MISLPLWMQPPTALHVSLPSPDKWLQYLFYHTHCLWALLNKALHFYKYKNITEGILKVRHESFNLPEWCKHFSTKILGHGVNYRLGISEDISWTSKFITEIGKCPLKFPLNADGISLSWKHIPSHYNYYMWKKKRVSGFEAATDHLALLLNGNSTENLKLKLKLAHHRMPSNTNTNKVTTN